MRFPNFEGEWERGELGKISKISKGSGISKDQLSDNGEPCILYGELYTQYKSEIIDEVRSRTNTDTKLLVRSEANDIIIPSSGETAVDISTARCVRYSGILLGGDLNIIKLLSGDGCFFSYQLNGVRKYDIARIAQGVSVVHLYGENLKKLNVFYPSAKEQGKIAIFLSLLDQRISTQIKIIEELKLLKVTLRNKIYKQIIKTSQDRQISELLDYEQPTKYIVANTEYLDNKLLTPVLTANKAFILGYTNENFGIYNKEDCIILDDFTMDLKYVNFPFKVKSSAIKILTAKRNINLKFIYEYLSFLRLTSGEHKRHYISEIEPMYISIPKIEIQSQMANILSILDEKICIEISQYELFIMQKQYLLRHLFI